MAVEWQRIEELYWKALPADPTKRPELLDQLCAGDAELRRELQGLLDADAQAMAFLESTALATAAKLLPCDGMGSLAGSTLGRYRVLSLAGTGGTILTEAHETSNLAVLSTQRGSCSQVP